MLLLYLYLLTLLHIQPQEKVTTAAEEEKVIVQLVDDEPKDSAGVDSEKDEVEEKDKKVVRATIEELNE